MRRKRGLLDRALGAVGLQRRSAYRGARHDRTLADWFAWVMSPAAELKQDQMLLRARSRDLVRNNPYCRRFLNALGENIIGTRGAQLQMRLRDATGARDRPRNKAIEAAWKVASRKGQVDVTRRYSRAEFNRLVIRSIARDGEVFVRHHAAFDNASGYAVQLIDPDLVDANYNVALTERGTRVVMGVEVDDFGAPVAYHVWTRFADQAGRTARERVRVAASEIDHLFVPFREGQIRGEPWLAPVLFPTRQLNGYSEAVVVHARFAAQKIGLITQSEDSPGRDPDADVDEEMVSEDLMFERLNAGEDVKLLDPSAPTVGYSEFEGAMLRMIAAGLNIAAATISGNLERANYSSLREGKNTEREGFRVLQAWFIEHVDEPIFARWFPLARLAGLVAVSGPTAQFLAAATFLPRGWDWVDPYKDLQATRLKLGMAFTSFSREAAALGLDLEELLEEIAEERKLAASLGIALPTMEQLLQVQMPAGDGQQTTATDGTGDSGSADGADGAAASERRRALHLQRGRI